MQQPKLHWSAYLWPGLAQVWLRGSWVGLTLAVGFTALGNVLLAATFVWNEWLPERARWFALGSLAVIWVIAWFDARADWRRMLAEWSDGERSTADPDERADRWFQEAQAAYLAGDWVLAEQTLTKLLRHEPRDAESRLMLATLWRHEGRFDAAREELDRLERLETAAPWQFEIASERERIYAACVERAAQDAHPGEGAQIGSPSPAEVPSPPVSAITAASSLGTGPGTQIAPVATASQTAATNRRMAA